MRAAFFLVAVSLVVLSAPAVVLADVIPGRWEKVEVTEAGTPLVVTMKSGERLEGQFVALEADVLVVGSTAPAGSRRLPRDQVKQVELTDPPMKPRAFWKATAIGAGAGLGLGILAAKTDGDDNSILGSDAFDGIQVASGLAVGLVGGLITGLMMDRNRGRTSGLLYRSIG